MNAQQEHEVAEGLREGRIEAWHALYDAYCRRVWSAVARQMGPHATDVADVVQETFLAAARSARSYDPSRGSLWLWLGGIARNHVALHFRNQRRHDRLRRADDPLAAASLQISRWLQSREAPPGAALATAEVATAVRAALTELPADYETLLTAKYFDGATVEQIATVEQSTSEAVRSKLARARRAFRRVFAKTSACADDGHGRHP
ncbi:MAG: sigma-70 family RNA polymerase sigma factor [Pirellulales bacterium]|nr:sigma-70 family RNA polymerase sigma factor [Pirellulales bacterium]